MKRSVLRSFVLPLGAVKAAFRAEVVQFLGVAPTPTGAALVLAVCLEDETSHGGSSLVNSSGQRLSAPNTAPLWHLHAVFEGKAPPIPPQSGEPVQYIGGVGAVNPAGALTAIFVFAQKVPE